MDCEKDGMVQRHATQYLRIAPSDCLCGIDKFGMNSCHDSVYLWTPSRPCYWFRGWDLNQINYLVYFPNGHVNSGKLWERSLINLVFFGRFSEWRGRMAFHHVEADPHHGWWCGIQFSPPLDDASKHCDLTLHGEPIRMKFRLEKLCESVSKSGGIPYVHSNSHCEPAWCGPIVHHQQKWLNEQHSANHSSYRGGENCNFIMFYHIKI